ncbi:hypothetical protein, partial [Catenulispora pinisilvae]|uniref:hypothetical protein n=1 Tax=Catenulispora pinisilvae TaxID=2705253 RepID=UPI001E3E0A3E
FRGGAFSSRVAVGLWISKLFTAFGYGCAGSGFGSAGVFVGCRFRRSQARRTSGLFNSGKSEQEQINSQIKIKSPSKVKVKSPGEGPAPPAGALGSLGELARFHRVAGSGPCGGGL